jgi:hypothetical protein
MTTANGKKEAALAKGVQAFCNSVRFSKVSLAQLTRQHILQRFQ